MVGSTLIQAVRVILQDIQAAHIKGEFWSDREILLALNAAQSVFINACLRLGETYLLSGLVTQSPFSASPYTLPADYLHYISGRVGASDTSNVLRTARIYLGGIGYTYFDTSHDAIIILNDTVFFKQAGADTSGILNYYRQPLTIVATAFNEDFQSYVYTDIIVKHAATLCGFKEVQISREMKNLKREIQNIVNYPPRIDNYINDVPKLKDAIKNAQQQQLKG